MGFAAGNMEFSVALFLFVVGGLSLKMVEA